MHEDSEERQRLRDLQQKVILEISSKALADLNAEVRHVEAISLASTALVASGLAAAAGFFGTRWDGTKIQLGAIANIVGVLGTFLWLVGGFAQGRLASVGRLVIHLRHRIAREMEADEDRLPDTHAADLVYEKHGARTFQSMLPRIIVWVGTVMMAGGYVSFLFISLR